MLKLKKEILRKVLNALLLFIPFRNRVIRSYFNYMDTRDNYFYLRGKGLKADSIPYIENFRNIIFGDFIKIGKNVKFFNKRLIILLNETEIASNSTIRSSYDLEIPKIIGGAPVDPKDQQDNELILIATTGRSGSNAIVEILKQNDSIQSFHEPIEELIALSTHYQHKSISESQASEVLCSILNYIPDPIVISDQKISNFISLINKIRKNLKVIWLVRSPEDFVNSAFHRGWFSNEEFGYSERASEPKAFAAKIFQRYRLNGYLCGEFEESHWKAMSSFERNCWYWTYWNKIIEKQLLALPRSQWMIVGLQELEDKMQSIGDFISESPFHYAIKRTNQAKYELSENWTQEQFDIIDNTCLGYYNYLVEEYNLKL